MLSTDALIFKKLDIDGIVHKKPYVISFMPDDVGFKADDAAVSEKFGVLSTSPVAQVVGEGTDNALLYFKDYYTDNEIIRRFWFPSSKNHVPS